jgi:hypothetical protein
MDGKPEPLHLARRADALRDILAEVRPSKDPERVPELA